MILVLFFCAIVILVMLAVMLPLLSTIRIEITDFELSNKKHIEPNYEIIYSLVLLNKIKWLSFHLNDKKMRKIYTKMHLERIDIKKIEKDISIRKIKEVSKKSKFIIRKFNLKIEIGTENASITAFIIPLISTLVSFILRN